LAQHTDRLLAPRAASYQTGWLQPSRNLNIFRPTYA
jgi:hypothetical protein